MSRLSSPLRTWIGGALWTGLLVGSLLLLDRRVIAPSVRVTEWARFETADHAVPSLPFLPAYLPATLAWPPGEIWQRGGESPGQWLGVREEEGEKIRLWIGWGEGELPSPLEALAGCRLEHSRCPEGWRFLSTLLKDDPVEEREVQVLSDLGPEQTRRILTGLSMARTSELP